MADTGASRHLSSTGELRAVPLRELTDADLDRFYSDLMEPAFPPEELMTRVELAEARQASDTEGIVLFRAGRPVGRMIIEDYLGGLVRLLAYLVVRASERNRGIGTELLARVTPARPDGLVLAEIDDPRFHPANDRADPFARLRFYDRLGCRLLPLPYVQPSLRPGSARVEDMLLITVGATTDHVDGGVIADFLEEYYFACEAPAALATDPTYQGLRAAALAGSTGQLPLLPLAHLTSARPGPNSAKPDADH